MMTSRPHVDDWSRLSSVGSPAARLASHVDDLAQVPDAQLPNWLTGLRLPAGWRPASIDGHGARPSQTAVRVPTSPQGGYGCDTVTLYRFTGAPDVDLLERSAATVLHDLRAADITSRRLNVPPHATGIAAVCATGSFATDGMSMWAQNCTYVAGNASPGQGMLLEHSMFLESRWLTALKDDVITRSRAVLAAFVDGACAPAS